ncbi:Flavin containing amine oxidase, putative [Penicillium digitatum]|uniref:Flavin containing amine oxidase, putative n=3 Tax=Penicillium digitatum TaxID=36651 RepID=K9G653_PEND2|nr:Flavin containing amine oxidase, putative [Penicillium digitatum Pd1]EKV06984.1 Flavin containing amine oxidase, putative [Penicillium digitatum Pd1]EKV08756.1 Flavin containing amine oxidase, putative [Penicillium digitatum PHI26]QQK41048.1 Flavin containing amine oxidase, putative [Penicillium digitatum]
MASSRHIGIIGAGISGLRCADILIQNGARVTILEARDRIGGRVHQSTVGDHTVDLGPNWIHGAGENPIMTIADETGTVMYDPEGGRHVSYSRDGHPLNDDVGAKVQEFVWTTIAEAFQHSNLHGESIPAETSLFDFFRERVQQTNFSDEETQLCLDACRLWGTYVGDQVDKQSLKFFRLEECVDGSNFIVASTYKRILEHVAKAAVAKADIHLNEPIISIKAPPRHNPSPTKHQVTVTTATGTIYDFDQVVVTCPLGWLKQNISAFTPALPPRLEQAINNISYGRLEKVYVTFPHAFWHTDNTSTSTTNTVFAQFLDPSYTPHPALIEWNQEFVSLASLPEPHAHPTLLFYTYGDGGAEIINRISELDPSSAEYRESLIEVLHPFYSRLPGYSAENPDCVPVALLATQWQKDVFAGNGSYCNFQVGIQEADVDVEVLRSGDGIGPLRGLWFAGEHTAPFVALGTTTGAFWSGERIARLICRGFGIGEVGGMGVKDDSLPSAGNGA